MYINRLKEDFSKKTRITVIQSLALSIINYGQKIWGTANKTHETNSKLATLCCKSCTGWRCQTLPCDAILKGTRLAEGKQKTTNTKYA